ncbi:MAG: glycine zipper 2TM domain-containing protein [Alphaproteobacteria bacterium]|nr:glycine zipper 2TM domain-containing protein [Alphaproteobacteria bacterium]
MVVKSVRVAVLPLLLVSTLAACGPGGGGVEPGVVRTSASAPAGEAGRVVSIREVDLRGGSGSTQGTVLGGVVGATGGAVIGGTTSRSTGGAVIGGLLGAVAGAIAGNAISRGGTGRGIEVTVQKDNGQTVAIAQRDDGDVQLGDRVQIVYDNNGVARAVRDTSRTRDQ